MLSVLLLRGAQTPGELKARAERMAPIESLEHVERLLESLAGHGYARRLTRRPGQKEDRFVHLLGGESEEASAPGPPAAHWPAPTPAEPSGPADAPRAPGWSSGWRRWKPRSPRFAGSSPASATAVGQVGSARPTR